MGRTRNAPVISANQLVAYNLRRARHMRGLTQEQAADLLEPYLGTRWSKATFSAAERSVEGTRVREFNGNEILAFAQAFDVPVTWFFLPPEELPEPPEIVCGGSERIVIGALLDAVMPYGPKPELAERFGAIAQQLADVAPGLRSELDDRVFRFAAARTGAIIATVLGSLDEDVANLRRLAGLLEHVEETARSEIASELGQMEVRA